MTTGIQPKAGQAATPRLHHKLGFGFVATLVLFICVLLPFVLGSAISEIIAPPRLATFSISPPNTPVASTYARLHLDLVALDQWAGTITIRVSGVHICEPACDWSNRIAFVAIPTSPNEGTAPPSDAIVLPPSAKEVTQDIKLPISGNPVQYPFDRYSVDFGVIGERVNADGTAETITAADAQGHFFATLDSRVPQVRPLHSQRLAAQDLPPNPDGYQYVAGARIILTRPFYLQILTVLLVLLVTSASAFAVFMRPVNEIVLSAGALILGIWGIRSVLLGSGVSGYTAVDLALSIVIMFLLSAIAFRSLMYLHALAGHPMRRLGLSRERPTDSDSAE